MELIQIAKALGADDITSPTIPFVKPSGGVTPYPTDVVGGPAITLSSDKVSLKKGEKAQIQITINSDGQEVSSFTFKIQFDATIFKVVDADAEKTGTQLSYNLAFFEQKQNNVDSTTGLIEFSAQSQGSATITSRVIGVIEVEALKDGVSEFKVLKDQSKLLDKSGSDILNSVNSVSLSVTDGNQITTPSPTSFFKPSFRTPDTALFDNNGSISAILLGLTFIITGYYLYRKRKEYDIQR